MCTVVQFRDCKIYLPMQCIVWFNSTSNLLNRCIKRNQGNANVTLDIQLLLTIVTEVNDIFISCKF